MAQSFEWTSNYSVVKQREKWTSLIEYESWEFPKKQVEGISGLGKGYINFKQMNERPR